MLRKVLFLMLILTAFYSVSYAEEPLVLFDEGHGQAFVISKEGTLHLSNFAQVLKKEGLDVQSTKESFDFEKLSKAKAVIISGPFKPITETEIAELKKYINTGGKLIVMLHISQPAQKLFESFNVTITNGAISEKENLASNKKTDFYVKTLTAHPLTLNLKEFAVYGSWGLIPSNSDVSMLALTSTASWIDFNRNGEADDDEPKGPFGIIATGSLGKGVFVFFADDAIFQNNFLKGQNLTLAENLAKFIKSDN